MKEVCKISLYRSHIKSSVAVAMEACKHVQTVGRTRRGARLKIRAALSTDVLSMLWEKEKLRMRTRKPVRQSSLHGHS